MLLSSSAQILQIRQMLNIMNKQEAQSKFALAARQKKPPMGRGKRKEPRAERRSLSQPRAWLT
jgi:hypothetical protein